MDYHEIDSFVRKLKFLIDAGIKASLNISTFTGEITVALEASLGTLAEKCPSTPRSWASGHKRGPSYDRRQKRRREVAENIAKQETIEEVAVQVTESADSAGQAEIAHSYLNKTDQCVKGTAGGLGQKSNAGEVSDEACADGKKNQDLPENYDATIHVTVFINNSPKSKIENDIYKSIFNIIDSKDHMKRNVGRVRVENVKNRSLDAGKFRHEATFIFFVDSSRACGKLPKPICGNILKTPNGHCQMVSLCHLSE